MGLSRSLFIYPESTPRWVFRLFFWDYVYLLIRTKSSLYGCIYGAPCALALFFM